MKENSSQNELVECPICHNKFTKREIRLHNIKCRNANNQLGKKTNNTNDTKSNINPKDEYKNFMSQIPSMIIDEKNIKTLIKNFILVFGNKIELLENNILEINKKIKEINDKNSNYFKKISDSLDIINNTYNNRDDNKVKKRIYQTSSNHNKSLFNKNETDINIKPIENNLIKNNIPNSSNKKKDGLRSEANNNNFYFSKKSKKIQYSSGTNIFNIQKEIITESNYKTINNNKFTEIINRKNQEVIEYKKRIKNEDYDNGNNYTMTEYKNNNNLNKDFQSYMRRSLSFGDFKKISDKKNNNDIDENKDEDENYEENDILVDSLDIIMEKTGNLEKKLY